MINFQRNIHVCTTYIQKVYMKEKTYLDIQIKSDYSCKRPPMSSASSNINKCLQLSKVGYWINEHIYHFTQCKI